MNEVATRGTLVVAMPFIEKHLNRGPWPSAIDVDAPPIMVHSSFTVSRMLKMREIHHMHLMHFVKNHWSKTSRFQLFWTNISILNTWGKKPWLSGATPHVIHFDLDRTGLSSRTNRVNRWWVRVHYLGSASWFPGCEGSRNFRFWMDELRWTSKSNTIGTKRCISLCFCFGAMCFCFSPTRMVECNSLWHRHFTTRLSTANLTPLICLSFWIATSLVTLQPKKLTPGRNFNATNPLAHGFRFGRPSKNHWMRTSWYWH